MSTGGKFIIYLVGVSSDWDDYYLTILPNHSLILIIIINKKFCLANSQHFPISHLWPHVSADGNMFQNFLSNNMEQSRQIILLHCQSKIKDVSSYLYSTSSSSGRSDRKILLLISNRNADMNYNCNYIG